MHPSTTTQLARGTINGHDEILIELVEPPDLPPAILLRRPQKPSICTPDAYANVAAGIMQIFATAVTELAAIRVWRKL